MARYIWPTDEEQIERHIGGPILTDELREELRCSLQPVGIMVKGGQTYYSCCRDYAYTVGYHHREYGECPICGRTAYHIKQCHIRKGERQEQFHFTYRRSIADENTVLIIGIWVAQIWEAAKYSDPETIPTKIREHSLIVIPYGGKPERYVNDRGWYSGQKVWNRRDKIIGGSTTSWVGGGIEQINHTWEFNNAIRGTRFEKMMRWVDREGGIYFTCDHANTLAEIAKHPQMEYMVARGLGELVKDKINHYTGAGLVNWRAKTIDKMLPLTRDELGRIKAKGYRFTSAHLMPIKYARQFGQTIKLEDAMGLMSKISCGYYDTEKALKKWGNRYGVAKILRYFANRRTLQLDIRLWMDYMEELAQLDCLDDMSMVFTKNLLEMHAQTSARIKIRESEADQKMLEEILPELQKKYSFQADGVILEPFGTLAEVIREGTEQSICIGSYAKRYAAGGTILCKMRRVDAPDTPWHAVEFDKNGRMVQCRGHHNRTWAEDEQEVRDFWAAWDKAHKCSTAVNIYIEQRRATA